jgi:hypothetical protein
MKTMGVILLEEEIEEVIKAIILNELNKDDLDYYAHFMVTAYLQLKDKIEK